MPGMRVNRKRGVLRFNVKLHSGAYAKTFGRFL